MIEKSWILWLSGILSAFFLMAGVWVLGAELPGEQTVEREYELECTQEESVPWELEQRLVPENLGEDQADEKVSWEETVDMIPTQTETWDPQEETGAQELSPEETEALENTHESLEGEDPWQTDDEKDQELEQESKELEGEPEGEAVLFLEKTAVWTQEKEYRGEITLRAGGWEPSDTFTLEDVISQYWTVDKEQLDQRIHVDKKSISSETGEEKEVEVLTFDMNEEDRHAGMAEFHIPIVLREEYREAAVDTRYPTNLDDPSLEERTGEGARLTWIDRCGETHVLGAASPNLLVPAGIVDFTVEKTADRITVRPGEEILYTITIQNTGERTLHSVLSTERFLDAGVQAAFLPQEGVTLNESKTQALVPKLPPKEQVVLKASVVIPEYFYKQELINQVLVVTDETGPMEEKISQAAVTLELPVTDAPVLTPTPIPTPTAWPLPTALPTGQAYSYATPTPLLYQGKASETVSGKTSSYGTDAPKTGDDTLIVAYFLELLLGAGVFLGGKRYLKR